MKQQFFTAEDYEFVQGGHLGYMDMEQGVFVNRKILYIKPDLYVIMDEMYTGGAHTYEQYWHFSERGELSLGAAAQVREPKLPGPESAGDPDPTLHKGGKDLEFELEQIGTPPVQKAVFKGDQAEASVWFMTPGAAGEMIDTRISRHYNQAVERKSIRVRKDGNGFTSLLTVICAGEAGAAEGVKVTKLPVKSALKGIYYPSAMAEALKIEAHGTEYVVVICHQEVNSPTDLVEVDGCLGFGNVIVFDKSKDVLVGTVMNY